MTKLTKSEVLHLAKLANLCLSPKEIINFQSQLAKVIAYISEICELDTANTLSTSQTTGIENNLRQDEVNTMDSFSQEEATAGTESLHNGYFFVDRIFDNEK